MVEGWPAKKRRNTMKKVEWLSFPLTVKFYITDKCNLRCKHCYLEEYKEEIPFTKIEA